MVELCYKYFNISKYKCIQQDNSHVCEEVGDSHVYEVVGEMKITVRKETPLAEVERKQCQ